MGNLTNKQTYWASVFATYCLLFATFFNRLTVVEGFFGTLAFIFGIYVVHFAIKGEYDK